MNNATLALSGTDDQHCCLVWVGQTWLCDYNNNDNDGYFQTPIFKISKRFTKT